MELSKIEGELIVVASPTRKQLFPSPLERRQAAFDETKDVDALVDGFDFTAFPLPIRLARWQHSASFCWNCAGNALHIYMKILPRSEGELRGVPRNPEGLAELNTCAGVDQGFLDIHGPAMAMETIRGKIKDMVMHEVYESIIFRGERIYDPHDNQLRPSDQPF